MREGDGQVSLRVSDAGPAQKRRRGLKGRRLHLEEKPRAAEMATARARLWGFEGRAFGGARKSAGVVGVVGHVRGDLRGRIEGGSPGDGPTENRFGCGGRRGRERKHAAATSWQIMIVSEGGDRGGGHDVSILAASALKLRGCAPRANVSTTLMRPPQQGHIWAIANASARSALAASATAHAGVAKRLRGIIGVGEQFAEVGDVGGASGAGEQAVVANAVEAVGQDVHQKAADEFVYWQRHGLDRCAAGEPRRGRDNPSSGR